MKKLDFLFGVLRLPVDLIAVTVAFMSAYWLRLAIQIPKEPVYAWPLDQYLKFILIFLPFWVIIFALEGLYNIKEEKRNSKEFSSIFLGVSAGIALVVVWVFFSRFLFFSRLVIIYAWILAIILISLLRFLLKNLKRFLYSRGIGLHQVMVIGQNEVAGKISTAIKEHPALGFSLAKRADRTAIEKLEAITTRTKIDEIILADPYLSGREVEKVLEFCEARRIIFKMIPSTFQLKTARVEMGSFSSYPLLLFRKTPLEGWGRVVKRIFDITAAMIGLIITSPFFLIIPPLIKLDSRGTVFFRHWRIGREGKIFHLLKFRSMIENAEALYPKLAKKEKKQVFFAKIKKDPRITRFGNFIRKVFIDEIPQILNVLKGEMSIVGPRPLTPVEFKQVSDFEKRYLGTCYIKPGMTGLWQVSGKSELSDRERLSLDIYYVENWSLFLDFLIILKTPLAVLISRRREE